MTIESEKLVKTDWDIVKAQLPTDWRAIAQGMKLVGEQPEQLGAKVDDIEPVLRLVLYQAGASDSLRATVARAASIGLLALSHVALHKWAKKLGPYLRALLVRMVDSASYAPEKWHGFDIIAGDATTVQRPGSKGTTARVHYALRLADLTPRHIEVTDEHGGETARRFRAEPGELWLLDRCYANPPGVGAIHDRGAHIAVRYNRGTLPVYNARGLRINVVQLLQQTTRRGEPRERDVVVLVGEQKISGRLCWLRLPAAKALEAQARAERERDAEGPCDADTLVAAEYVVVFTTAPKQLRAACILELYRARWQIELEFKRSKTLRELDRLPNFLPETIYSWICAKLLLQVVASKIASPSGVFPPGGARLRLLPAVPAAKTQPRARRARAVVRRKAGVERRVRRTATHSAA
ncbi:MAG: transposase [Polyangiaceae bacterium]|nr:transposase [Polyangiaceae bacterium]